MLSDAGIEVVLSGVQMPRMNSIMERWVQTCRHELLDLTLIWNQRHLPHSLREFEHFYNEHRLHRTLRAAAPLRQLPEPITDPEQIAHLDVGRRSRLGGTLHEYRHAALPARMNNRQPHRGTRPLGATAALPGTAIGMGTRSITGWRKHILTDTTGQGDGCGGRLTSGFRLVAQGQTDAEIAEKLFIGVSTAGTHLDQIRDKSGCRRRADLASRRGHRRAQIRGSNLP